MLEDDIRAAYNAGSNLLAVVLLDELGAAAKIRQRLNAIMAAVENDNE